LLVLAMDGSRLTLRRRTEWRLPSGVKVSGGHGGGDTPVPFSNTAVKPARADGGKKGLVQRGAE